MGAAYGASLDWWMTPIAGKNVLATPIFLHLCYLDILDQIMQEQRNGPLLIVCDDEYLLDSINRLLRSAGHDPVRTPGWPAYITAHVVVGVARWVYRWCKGIGLLAMQLAAARVTRHRRSSAESAPPAREVLIHTCIDDDCLGEDGKFRDRYFGGLADWLRGRGYRVTVLPWVYNTRRGVFRDIPVVSIQPGFVFFHRRLPSLGGLFPVLPAASAQWPCAIRHTPLRAS